MVVFLIKKKTWKSHGLYRRQLFFKSYNILSENAVQKIKFGVSVQTVRLMWDYKPLIKKKWFAF